MRRFSLIAYLFATALLCAESSGQDVRAVQVADSVRALYQNLEYDAAEQLARDVLESDAILSIEDRAELHFLVGLVSFVRSDSTRARGEFETALTLNPEYQPDPVLVPPRVMAFFNRVRTHDVDGVNAPALQVRYLLVHDLRPAAALRSAVLPGWGQIYRGDTARGGVMAGAWIATAGTALTLSLLGNGDEDLRGVRIASMSAAGIVWLYSYLDALLVPAHADMQGVRLSPVFSHDAIGLRTTLQL